MIFWLVLWVVGEALLYAASVVFREPRLMFGMFVLAALTWGPVLYLSRCPKGATPPRNLLTHREETVIAMMEFENPFNWLVMQRAQDVHSLEYVESQLMLCADPHGPYEFFVAGSDGRKRWAVRRNGDVAFSTTFGGPSVLADKAARLRFEVV